MGRESTSEGEWRGRRRDQANWNDRHGSARSQGYDMTDSQKQIETGTAERIQSLQLKSGRTEQELASDLGLTMHSHSDLTACMPSIPTRCTV